MNTLTRSLSSRRQVAGWLKRMPLPLLEAGLVLCWSSGFIGARFSVDHASPMLVVFWRCVLVSLVLLPFVARAVRAAPRRVLLENAGIGLLAMAGYLYGVTRGIALGVPAGLAALLADLLPIGMALLSTLVLRQRLGRGVWLGLAVGLGGVLLVTWDALALGGAPLWAYGLPLLGMLSLAIATLGKRQRTAVAASLGLLPNLWLQCSITGVAFGFIASAEGSLLPQASFGFTLSVLWTAGLATLGGYGLYWLCLSRATPTRVASVLYLSPGVTLIWAWAMFGEPLSAWMLLGTAVSAVGIGLVVRGESR
ncbi:DMT family transporter [Stutzerimonas chloritidismutans]|uniref:DMT family transporter n=1 Tax=Stutzerimonas chloritidismutans TaxID=203192 RepID=UPI003F18C106